MDTNIELPLDGCMALGDVNSDGYDDVFVSGMLYSTGEPRAYLLINDAAANFSVSPQDFPAVSGRCFVEFFDMNSDGHLDLLYLGPSSHNGSAKWTGVYVNDGAGQLDVPPTADLFPSIGDGSFCRGDLDGDGVPEIVLVGTDLEFSSNSSEPDYLTGYAQYYSGGNYDMAILSYDHELQAFFHKPLFILDFYVEGGFTVDFAILGTRGDPPQNCLIRDFDVDGFSDLVVTTTRGTGFNSRTYLFMGRDNTQDLPADTSVYYTPGFTAGDIRVGTALRSVYDTDTTNSFRSGRMAAADVNGDGDEDILFCGITSSGEHALRALVFNSLLVSPTPAYQVDSLLSATHPGLSADSCQLFARDVDFDGYDDFYAAGTAAVPLAPGNPSYRLPDTGVNGSVILGVLGLDFDVYFSGSLRSRTYDDIYERPVMAAGSLYEQGKTDVLLSVLDVRGGGTVPRIMIMKSDVDMAGDGGSGQVRYATPPTTPLETSMAVALLRGDQWELRWSAPSDNQGRPGVRYMAYVRDESGNYIVSPMVVKHTFLRFRWDAAVGNSTVGTVFQQQQQQQQQQLQQQQGRLPWVARAQTASGGGSLFWAVQAVDTAGRASGYSAEFVLNPVVNNTTPAVPPLAEDGGDSNSGLPWYAYLLIVPGGLAICACCLLLLVILCLCALCALCLPLAVLGVVVLVLIMLVLVVGMGASGLALVRAKKQVKALRYDLDAFDGYDGEMVADGLEREFRELKFEDLTFQTKIGEGAFGKVFLGYWRENTVVAIKELNVTADEKAKVEFVNEANVMARVGNHPNVVHFIGAVTTEDRYYMISEFARNGSLLDFMLRNPLGDTARLNMAIGAAAGVAHLHAEGIVHRDIAARNFLVGNDGQIMVTDFGMSRVLEASGQEASAARTTSNIGPVRWMSPESISRREYSEKSDVYMFGMLLYELVTSNVPFSDLSIEEVYVGKTQKNLVPVIPPTCMSIFADVMRACWHVEPLRRPKMPQVWNLLRGGCDEEVASAMTTTSLVGGDPVAYSPSSTGTTNVFVETASASTYVDMAPGASAAGEYTDLRLESTPDGLSDSARDKAANYVRFDAMNGETGVEKEDTAGESSMSDHFQRELKSSKGSWEI